MMRRWMPWLLAIALVVGAAIPAMASQPNRYQDMTLEELQAESRILLEAMADDQGRIEISADIPPETRLLLQLLIAQIEALARERDAALTGQTPLAQPAATQDGQVAVIQTPAGQVEVTQSPAVTAAVVSADVDALNLQIETLTRERDEARAQLDGMVPRAEYDAQIAALTAERDDLFTRLDNAADRAEVDRLNAEVETLTRERDEARAAQGDMIPRADFDAQVQALAAERDEALARIDGMVSRAEYDAQIQTLTRERDEARARLEGTVEQAEVDGLRAQVDTLNRERDEARAALDAAYDQAEVDALNAQIQNLTRERDEARAAQNDMIPRADFDAQVQALAAERDDLRARLDNAADRAEVDRLNAEVETLTRERDEARAAGDGTKLGLGMVTSIGDVAVAAADRNGYALVNTIVAAVVLDEGNRIVDIEWDVQRTNIQFDAAGAPIDYIPGELRRLDDDNAFGLRGNDANRAWIDPLGEFEAFVTGRTIDEVLALDLDTVVAGQPVLPEIAVSEGGFVSVTRGDYIEALRQAVRDAD